jgi:hypothetical protein
MTSSMETELDGLFRLPPAEMVAARNALADRLKKSGDKAAAATIKALKRPTPAAWALNQVHFEQAALLDRARGETARLRELHQLGSDPQQLSAAIAAQRNAMYAVIDAAARRCQTAGLPADGAQQRKLYTTLQAWLAGQGDEAPGRMTHDIEASGFDAITALGLQAMSAAPTAISPPVEQPSGPPVEAGPDPREIERATALVRERGRQAREAGEALGEKRAELERAESAVEQARSGMREAEEALRTIRAQLAERETALTRVRVARDAADQVQRAADRALADAEAALAALE